MALQEIEHEPFQIVDQISECDQLQLSNTGSFNYRTSVGGENGKSAAMQYRFEPSFSYRDEGSLTPRKHLANPTIELTDANTLHQNTDLIERKDEPDTSQETLVSCYSRDSSGSVGANANANADANADVDTGVDDKHGITRCVADVIVRRDSDEKVYGAKSLDEMLEESDDDTVPQRLAKHVLRGYKSSMNGPRLSSSSGFCEPKGFFMTQVMINLHVAVLRDMMKLMPPRRGRSMIDMGCKETVMYTCRSLEMPGISSVSGTQFLKMTLENKIHVVLSIARPFIETYWNDYDDSIYTECHRQLEIQAKFCVKTLYHSKLTCCIFI